METTTNASSLLAHLCSIEDVFQRHLLSFLAYQDVGRLELVSRGFKSLLLQQQQPPNHSSNGGDDGGGEGSGGCWKILCQRDFAVTTAVESLVRPVAPVYSSTTSTATSSSSSSSSSGFHTLQQQDTWKDCYHQWIQWQRYTANSIHPQHMVTSIQLWTRMKQVLTVCQLTNIQTSLAPCPNPEFFQRMNQEQQYHQKQQQQDDSSPFTTNNMNNNKNKNNNARPWSALLALFAVHGGQLPLEPRSQDNAFFAGLLGSYSCYHDYYSMRLLNITDFCSQESTSSTGSTSTTTGSGSAPAIRTSSGATMILIGVSIGRPRSFLYWCPADTTSTSGGIGAAAGGSSNGSVGSVDSIPYCGGGIMRLVRDNAISSLNERRVMTGNQNTDPPMVGRNGILGYFKDYIERLERGFFKPCTIVEASPNTRGICLFPDEGEGTTTNHTNNEEEEATTLTTTTTTTTSQQQQQQQRMTSCCVTRGIEVKASARWFLPSALEQRDASSSSSGGGGGLNFGYSVRIRMVSVSPEDLAGAATTQTTMMGANPTVSRTTFQLVGRHWEFQDGHGKVRRVDGDAVIGKQPLLYCHRGSSTVASTTATITTNTTSTGSDILFEEFGYEDLGPAGLGDDYPNETFRYQSQSGNVAGTYFDTPDIASAAAAGGGGGSSGSGGSTACIRGTFSFVPGSLEEPKGPLFHVQVGSFPLTVPVPFY